MKRTIPGTPRNMKQRIRFGFLLFPKTLALPDSDFKQMRCLCFSSWLEEWRTNYRGEEDDFYHDGNWREIEWAEE